MTLRARTVLGAALALVLLPASARAQDLAPTPIEPLAPGAQVRTDRAISFRVRATAPAATVLVRVSGSPATDATGLLESTTGASLDLPTSAGGEADVHVARTSRGFLLARRPGPYFWQAYVAADPVTGAAPTVGPVQALTVTGPHRAHPRLYPTFGPRGHAAFFLSSAQVPATVAGSRFAAIARGAARRWHLRVGHWTSAAPGRVDGWNVAGFSTLPDGVLGVQTDFRRGGRLLEQDVQFNLAAPWSDGPGYPDFDHVDLQSVVLHELGHLAGIKRHRARCANSPMVAGLGAGEWWRGPQDSWFFGCPGLATASAADAFLHGATRWRFARRVVELP